MPYSKDLFMIKLNGPDNVFLANFKRFVGKLLGPQARDGTSALMRSLIQSVLTDVGTYYMILGREGNPYKIYLY